MRQTVSNAFCGVTAEEFQRLKNDMAARWGAVLVAIRPDGEIQFGKAPCPRPHHDCPRIRRKALEEAFRWGEPTVELCPSRRLLWAAPLLHNQRLLGGIVALVPEKRIGGGAFDFRAAAEDLRRRLEEENLTNGPLLELRRSGRSGNVCAPRRSTNTRRTRRPISGRSISARNRD